jgi:hypothetical protein
MTGSAFVLTTTGSASLFSPTFGEKGKRGGRKHQLQ